VALQALAKDKRLKFGVIESTFSKLDQIIYDYQKRFTGGIGAKWVSDRALEAAGNIADFEPNKLDPAEIAKSIEQPVFMAHGSQDEHIAIEYGKENFANLKSSQKEFYEVAGGDHFNLWRKGGKAYGNAIFSFIERYFPVKR